ncbi:MAG: alpha/beta fold hydrolase [Planctomycetota bacterium]
MKRPLSLRRLVVLYLLLLGASHVVRGVLPYEAPLRPDQSVVEISDIAIDAGGEAVSLDRTIRLAVTDLPGPDPDAPVIVLIHGSPVASSSLVPIAEALAGSARVLLPDLPGMGSSTAEVSSLSVRAHGLALAELLRRQDVPRAHLVGYSMGGGPALECARLAPDRVASITLLASIGVQEFELLGDYHLNHAIHGLQLLAITALFEGTPHFGLLDRSPVNPSYARNFFETDQRPLRAILESLEAPLLVLHGTEDALVPETAALEHHRLVPQSRLVRFDGGHITPIIDPESIRGPIAEFVASCERGEAPTRSGASEARAAAAAVPFDSESLPGARGFALVVMVLLLALATLASEDLACLGGGILVANGSLAFLAAVLGCAGGILLGDIGIFLIGRILGRRAVRVAPIRWLVSERTLEGAAAWLDRRGAAVIFASRFTPGLRVPTYLAAGILPTRLLWFVGYFVLATLLWTPLLVGLGALVGRPLLDAAIASQEHALWILLGELLLILLLWKLLLPLCSHRGRRQLRRRWIRTVRFEYWPVWVFYPPLVLYAMTLMLRHRSIGVFTAANPAFEHGGFIGESKREILTAMESAGFSDEGGAVARWCHLPEDSELESRVARVREFRAELEAREPGSARRVVLKPDRGERGSGVVIVETEAEVRSYLEQHPLPAIAQRFTPGLEYGVFYIRDPREEAGAIFAITDKRFPSVVGDGTRSIERLILDDPTLLPMAPHYLDAVGARSFEVPGAGEEVPLTEIGTHALGSIFLDGEAHRTPALLAAIERISRAIPGFHFGRYDIRVPSIAALEAGESLTVLELNGVTSEATNIYDPRHGVLHAYRTLFRQWHIVYEIGAENARRGAPVPPSWVLIRRLFTSDPRPEIVLSRGEPGAPRGDLDP